MSGPSYSLFAPKSIFSISAQRALSTVPFTFSLSPSFVKWSVPQSVWWTIAISSSVNIVSKMRTSLNAWRMFPPAFRLIMTSVSEAKLQLVLSVYDFYLPPGFILKYNEGSQRGSTQVTEELKP